ncbi:MAG: general secretion pathway protein I [Candidatus Azotimanducaceae bacterium]
MKIFRQDGFTLLEAIVALVILATSSMSIYAWLGNSLDSLGRVNKTIALAQLSDDLDAYFRTIRLDGQPSRTFSLNGYQIDWTASLVEPKRVGVSNLGSKTDFELGLYDLDVSIYREQILVGNYETRLVSHKYIPPLNVKKAF